MYSNFQHNTQFNILTPSGFKNFYGVRKSVRPTLRLEFSDGEFIVVTSDHQFSISGKLKRASDCKIGDWLDSIDKKYRVITSITDFGEQDVYDPVEVSDGNLYNSGPVISHNCSFLSSSYTLISPQCLAALSPTKPILEEEDGYKEFVAPIKGHSYTLTVDTATGQKKDSSAFSIIDVTEMPYRVVATYANNGVRTLEYPQIIVKYASKYFNPWILIEINDIGRDIGNILYGEFSYPNLVTVRMGDKRQGQKMSFGTGMNRQLGLRMTAAVKKSGCAIMKALVENQQLIVSDHRLISELSTFIQNGRVYEAQLGKHDDLVMTLVLFGWLSLQPGFVEITNTRALSEYTNLLKNINDEHETISEPNDDANDRDRPLPIYGNNLVDDPDMWLLMEICKSSTT